MGESNQRLMIYSRKSRFTGRGESVENQVELCRQYIAAHYGPEEAARAHQIPLKVIHITDREAAQNVPAPVTTYALFRDGKFLTQGIQSDKKFLALAGVEL